MVMSMAALAGYALVALATDRRGKLAAWWPLLVFVPCIATLGPLIADAFAMAFFLLTLGGEVKGLPVAVGASLCFAACAACAYLASRPRTPAFHATCGIAAVVLLGATAYHLSDDTAASGLRQRASCEHHPRPAPPQPVVAHGLSVSDMASFVVLGRPDRLGELHRLPTYIQVETLGYVYDALERSGLPYIEFPLPDTYMSYQPWADEVRRLVDSSDTRLLRFTLRHRAPGVDCRVWDIFHSSRGGWDSRPEESPADECVVVEAAAVPAADLRMSTVRIDAKSGYEVRLETPDALPAGTMFVHDPFPTAWCEQGEAAQRFVAAIQVASAPRSTAP